MMVWTYAFEDGTVLRLLDAGLTIAEICELQDLHGPCRPSWERNIELFKQFPSAQPDIVEKILAAGKEWEEVRIYIGGRLFAVRELAQ